MTTCARYCFRRRRRRGGAHVHLGDSGRQSTLSVRGEHVSLEPGRRQAQRRTQGQARDQQVRRNEDRDEPAVRATPDRQPDGENRHTGLHEAATQRLEHQVDDFCGLYVDQIVPCLTSKLLPAIATIRAKYADDCCDAWATSAIKDFGYTVSDELIKFARLLDDVMCSRQTPSFLGNASQVCGCTFSQSTFTANDSATMGSDLIVNLQVPTDQVCLKAEGKAYVNVNGGSVAALPLAQRTNVFDMQALFSTTKCLKGSEFFPFVSGLFSSSVNAVVAAYFSKACVHIPIKYANKCSYTRSVSLVDWASEPSKVKVQDLGSGGSAVSSDPASNISFQPAAPTKSSAASDLQVSSTSVLVGVTTAALALAHHLALSDSS